VIGVAARPEDMEIVEEFFELFKTPWEPAVPGRKYRIGLSADGGVTGVDAPVRLVFGATELPADRTAGVRVDHLNRPADIRDGERAIPIYGGVASFSGGNGAPILTSDGKSIGYRYQAADGTTVRVGYELFDEVRHLLTDGQPVSNAMVPTLELHIALLRKLIVESNASFVEIPPRPDGYRFTCCLTHDLDFFGIRRHGLDRTLAGFVARASIGTVAGLVRGRRRLSDAVRNFAALSSLPLVFLRLVRDFWHPFEDYARMENGRRSTFFLVPFKGRAGRALPNRRIKSWRAVAYDLNEIRHEIQQAGAAGNEIAVHGIDAWHDASSGQAELARVTSITGRASAGVRMHWLYFAAGSAAQLEKAGFAYDSTWGYNEAVGYRAGTSQVFRLSGTERLMELPLSIMDSALFYPSRMGLSEPEALARCSEIVANARSFGGTVVINWHDRSLAPERLWVRPYEQLLKTVDREADVWFTTAEQAVEWFRWRRSIRFVSDGNGTSTAVTVSASKPCNGLPAAIVRTCRPSGSSQAACDEQTVDGSVPVRCSL
jgi:hypothetical protein